MSNSSSLDLDQLIDGQRIGLTTVTIVAIAMLVLVSDGFDIALMSYVAPDLMTDWHVSAPRLVPVLTASLLGMMAGGPLGGMLGDRFGRKRLIFWSLLVVSATTFSAMAARTLGEFTAIRFATGIALGAVIPNVTALVAELAPRSYRGRMLVIVLAGVIIGTALPGLAAAALGSDRGWRALLLVGGLIPLAFALMSIPLLPESLRYLVERVNRQDHARRIARRLRPDLTIADDTILRPAVAVRSKQASSIKNIVAGDLKFVSPLLWVSQISAQLAGYFVLIWLPTLLRSSGASKLDIGINGSLFPMGGLVSMLLLVFVIDRFGMATLTMFLLVAAPLVAFMVGHEWSSIHQAAAIWTAGFFVLGAQSNIVALLGLLYPTAIRSSGTGWTHAFGRIGAIAAPTVGGILLALGVGVDRILFVPAALLLVGAIASALLASFSFRRYGNVRPNEFAVPLQKSEPLPLSPLSAVLTPTSINEPQERGPARETHNLSDI